MSSSASSFSFFLQQNIQQQANKQANTNNTPPVTDATTITAN